MNYLSVLFFCFVAALLALYYALPTKWNLRKLLLLAASVAFYLNFNVKYGVFLLFVAASTYISALLLSRVRWKKTLFSLCILFNLAVWFVIKVLPWGVEVTNKVFARLGTDFRLDFSVLVPVGISYFTLQAIAYLTDVYKGKFPPKKNFLNYLLFLSYFPAIVQGPISRYDELAPEFQNKTRFSFDTFRNGLVLILFGLVKKMVVADRLAIFVNAGFDGYESLGGTTLYLVAVGYAVQLYMDFSGCVDICRGVSLLFGIELKNNFNRPYFATSIRDFWGKWHMTLSRWLKDYVYIPLGGNRKGAFRKYRNLLITFLVSGLWHGAGFSFFFWGGLHAFYQIFGAVTEKVRAKARKLLGVEEGSLSERIYQVLITFHLVTFAWIFFRAPRLKVGAKFVLRLFQDPNPSVFFDGSLFTLGVSEAQFIVLVLHLVAFFAVELLTKSQKDAVGAIVKQHLFVRWGIYLLLIFDVILFGTYGAGYDLGGFLYGGF